MKIFKKCIGDTKEGLDICNELSTLSFLIESQKSVIVTVLTTPGVEVGDMFDRYQKEYTDNFARYQMLQEKVSKTYIPMGVSCNWTLSFTDAILEVTLTNTVTTVDEKLLEKEGFEGIEVNE